ncbi:cupin domain-containing protein [Primorskyibacter aestuariivivens]|uniref:cupin domain-containing protein n=1 Tax=Primorskyibacter aestuariivivens TaxID=1888912 RepID=UPI00230179B5|nr:cupin domain-containing protein [Primorskyibacter aestuariivivens]MDA7427025.1 cupin domain-containing protein [Primorskyibacter aestuariivivens]
MTRSLILTLVLTASAAMAHEPLEWNGSKIQVLLDKEETGGDMGMFTTQAMAPGGPPRHVHQDAGEAFVVLEGAATILVDGETVMLEQGQAAFAPKGADHTFRIPEAGGKLLVIVTPGGFEGFFEATKHLKLPDELDAFTKISAEYGQIFTGPPLDAE